MHTASQGGVLAHIACGIDIGGSGVKAALVDLDTGEYIGDQIRIPTPAPATPDAVARVCRELVDRLGVGADVPIGVTFPAPVFDGVIPFMANLDQSWVGTDVNALMSEHLGRPVVPLNDADAAGIAEVAYGAAKDAKGVVVFTTQGTGIGSAIIVDGRLMTNTELGHLELDGHDAEKRASSGQKTLQGLDWAQWAERLQRYYSHVEMLLSPDLFVVGGGHPSRTAVADGLERPTRRRGRAIRLLLGLAPGGVYLADAVARAAGGLLPHLFTLTALGGGLFSVALSRGSPRVAVSHHPALWSPDVPRALTRTRPPGRLDRHPV